MNKILDTGLCGDWILSDKGLRVYRWESGKLIYFFISLSDLIALYDNLPIEEIRQAHKEQPF